MKLYVCYIEKASGVYTPPKAIFTDQDEAENWIHNFYNDRFIEILRNKWKQHAHLNFGEFIMSVFPNQDELPCVTDWEFEDALLNYCNKQRRQFLEADYEIMEINNYEAL